MQNNGHPTVCGEAPFELDETCNFECDSGFKLPPQGIFEVACRVTLPEMAPAWDNDPSECISKGHRASVRDTGHQ